MYGTISFDDSDPRGNWAVAFEVAFETTELLRELNETSFIGEDY